DQFTILNRSLILNQLTVNGSMHLGTGGALTLWKMANSSQNLITGAGTIACETSSPSPCGIAYFSGLRIDSAITLVDVATISAIVNPPDGFENHGKFLNQTADLTIGDRFNISPTNYVHLNAGTIQSTGGKGITIYNPQNGPEGRISVGP